MGDLSLDTQRNYHLVLHNTNPSVAPLVNSLKNNMGLKKTSGREGEEENKMKMNLRQLLDS